MATFPTTAPKMEFEVLFCDGFAAVLIFSPFSIFSSNSSLFTLIIHKQKWLSYASVRYLNSGCFTR